MDRASRCLESGTHGLDGALLIGWQLEHKSILVDWRLILLRTGGRPQSVLSDFGCPRYELDEIIELAHGLDPPKLVEHVLHGHAVEDFADLLVFWG